jgi:pimeloyl-ACP methyl ester carboxylesterase
MGEIHFAERGKGFPVILIHGFCETNRIWDSFAERLSSNFRVITPDLPGFGKSPLPNGKISIKNVASTLNRRLHQLEIQKCLVIGHSLGGYVTLSMVAQRPGLIAGLGLFHSTALADSDEKRQNRNKVFEFVNKNGVPPFVDSFVPGLFHQKDNSAIEEVRDMASQTRKDVLMAYTLAMRDRLDNSSLLAVYEGDCLFIAGKYDTIIPCSAIEEQSRINRRSELQILENSGHMGMFEDAEAAYEGVRSFCFKVEKNTAKH